MSDTVTIHNGHCTYHGPANKAPVWAARGAITDPQPPAPTMSLQIDPGPVPAQRVPDGASIAPELCGVGAHESHATRNENTFALKRNLSAPSSVHTRSGNACSAQSAASKPPQVGNTIPVPAPLTSFEDTTHAWEEGYRAGCATVKVKPPIEADGYNVEEMLANLGAHPEWPAMRKAGDVKLYFLNEGDAHKIRFAALEGLA